MMDRQKTGPLKIIENKHFVPGPCFYGVQVEDQVILRETKKPIRIFLQDYGTGFVSQKKE